MTQEPAEETPSTRYRVFAAGIIILLGIILFIVLFTYRYIVKYDYNNPSWPKKQAPAPEAPAPTSALSLILPPTPNSSL